MLNQLLIAHCAGQWALEQAGLLDKFLAAARPEGQDMRVLDKDGTVLHEIVGSTGTEAPDVGHGFTICPKDHKLPIVLQSSQAPNAYTHHI